MYAYYSKTTEQVAMICKEKTEVDSTVFLELEFPSTNDSYKAYLINGGSLYVKNGQLILQ